MKNIDFSTPIKFRPYGADLRQLRRGCTPAGAAYERIFSGMKFPCGAGRYSGGAERIQDAKRIELKKLMFFTFYAPAKNSNQISKFSHFLI